MSSRHLEASDIFKPTLDTRTVGVALLAAFAMASCGSDSGSNAGTLASQPDAPQAENPDAIVPGMSSGGAPGECASRAIERRAVWLSDIQFANAITRLLGPSALDPEQSPDPALKAFSQKGIVVNTSLLHTRLDLAQRAASSLSGRFTDVTACGETDDACARDFVSGLARRAFRRPVQDAEIADLNAVYAAGLETDITTGVALAVQAMIASPSFNYRTEFGGDTGAEGTVELTPHELGSLLAFWLTDAPPDAELIEAANQGTLSEPAELERQVERLLSSPESQNSVTLTLMSAWGMSNLFGATKDPVLFPEYGPLLQSNMFEETRLFLQQALWAGDSTIGQVLTSRQSFVNQALAEVYGVPFTGSDPTQFVPVELPADERAGLLTQPSLLAARARSDNTSVVARGLFVRSALLCLPRPPPPPEAVIAQIEALLAADMTERERAEFRAVTSPCNGCHRSIDGFGLMLESYDAVGRFRTELEGEPIDPTVALDSLGFPGTFDGVVDFAATASESTDFSACLARHLAVYATGDDGLSTSDCELREFKQMAPTQTNLRQIVSSLAGSALLGTRSGE